MKSSKKKVIIFLIIIGLIIIMCIAKLKNKKEDVNNPKENIVQQEENKIEEFVEVQIDGSKVNTSEKLHNAKELDGLEITNIQLREKGGITTLLADVENKTGAKKNTKKVKVDILDKSGNTIVTLKGLIDGIEVGGKVQLNIAVTADVSNAYDFRISNF